MPINLNGSETSHASGHSSTARMASGQQTASRLGFGSWRLFD
ncbi:MAG: hypothetical protein V9E93_15780 [Steroidobacteraceae bacterium]